MPPAMIYVNDSNGVIYWCINNVFAFYGNCLCEKYTIKKKKINNDVAINIDQQVLAMQENTSVNFNAHEFQKVVSRPG